MKKKILIIEDNNILSDMYKFKLTLEGFEVEVENESINSVKTYDKFKPDLIILDLMMPQMNGFEILEIIKKQRNEQVKILVLSNLNEEKDKKMAFELGANNYILKSSLSPKELSEEAKKCLEI